MGNRTEEENRKELEEAHITLAASNYRVAILEIDLYSEIYDAEEGAQQQSALMAFAVYNISDEIVRLYHAGVVCQGNDNQVLILFQTNKPREFERTVIKICSKISNEVKQFIKLGLTIGIGRYITAIKNIYKSYEEAETAINYRYLLGEGRMIDMEEIGNKLEQDITIDDLLEALSLSIKWNDRVKIDEVFLKIQENIKQSLVSKNRSCLYLQQIVGVLTDILRASDLIGTLIYTMKDQLLTDIVKSKTFAQAMELLRDYCYRVGDELENQKNTTGKKHALRAIDYIEKNYADPDLNLNSICSYLSISTSRFSTIFKNAMGETFMDILIGIRMQKAKELLENTDLKNYEIAERVGFSDPHYFSISFKKVTGKTPTKYAREMR